MHKYSENILCNLRAMARFGASFCGAQRSGARSLPLRSICGLLLCLSSAGLANADSLEQQPVGQRVHEHLQAEGLIYGDTFFYPEASAGLEFNSNVFGEPAAQDDYAYILSSALRILRSRDDSAFGLNLSVKHFEFDSFQNENRTEASARLRVARKLARGLDLEASLAAARRFEARGDSLADADSVVPVGYQDLDAQTLVTKRFNRLGIALGAGIRSLQYNDGESVSGSILDQSSRDGIIVTGSIKPFYELLPGYNVFVQTQINQRDYEGSGSENRDSRGYQAAAGVEFPISATISGSLQAGYLEQEYDSVLIPAARGPSAAANLIWLMTPLMTVSLIASRTVAEVVTPEQFGRIDLEFGGRIDYEVRRNLIASAAGLYRSEEFLGSVRDDEVFEGEMSIKYSLNRFFDFGLSYFYFDRISNIEQFHFSRHKVMVNVAAKY